MLNFTKTVSCSVIGTAPQIDTKLMHHFERFRKNLLVKFYSMKDFIFTDTRDETGKNFSLGLVAGENIGSLKFCHVLLTQSSENVFVFRYKDCWAKIHDMSIVEEPFGTS